MQYPNIHKASFLDRPNRFIAHVERDGAVETVHVKNTGRCRELLVPGAAVYLVHSDAPARRTAYDLVAVEKGARLINMDAQAPNRVFAEFAQAGRFLPGLTFLRPEYRWENSRFDFYAEAGDRRMLVEVKGVTLEEEGAVLFPDAPTERGVKHLRELTAAQRQGYETALVFVIQMRGVTYFAPNDRTHPAFGEALRTAAASGVTILAYDCDVTPESLMIREKVPIVLDKAEGSR